MASYPKPDQVYVPGKTASPGPLVSFPVPGGPRPGFKMPVYDQVKPPTPREVVLNDPWVKDVAEVFEAELLSIRPEPPSGGNVATPA